MVVLYKQVTITTIKDNILVYKCTNIYTCVGFSLWFNPCIFLRVVFKQKFTYLEDKLSSFPQKGFFISEGKFLWLQLYLLKLQIALLMFCALVDVEVISGS